MSIRAKVVAPNPEFRDRRATGLMPLNAILEVGRNNHAQNSKQFAFPENASADIDVSPVQLLVAAAAIANGARLRPDAQEVLAASAKASLLKEKYDYGNDGHATDLLSPRGVPNLRWITNGKSEGGYNALPETPSDGVVTINYALPGEDRSSTFASSEFTKDALERVVEKDKTYTNYADQYAYVAYPLDSAGVTRTYTNGHTKLEIVEGLIVNDEGSEGGKNVYKTVIGEDERTVSFYSVEFDAVVDHDKEVVQHRSKNIVEITSSDSALSKVVLPMSRLDTEAATTLFGQIMRPGKRINWYDYLRLMPDAEISVAAPDGKHYMIHRVVDEEENDDFLLIQELRTPWLRYTEDSRWYQLHSVKGRKKLPFTPDAVDRFAEECSFGGL